uniref:ANF_receptor domain-containing protein n=1 Tax=Panagrellus redivivus TaxID=6233 RepID=A0A7E4W5N2_PANRE
MVSLPAATCPRPQVHVLEPFDMFFTDFTWHGVAVLTDDTMMQSDKYPNCNITSFAIIDSAGVYPLVMKAYDDFGFETLVPADETKLLSKFLQRLFEINRPFPNGVLTSEATGSEIFNMSEATKADTTTSDIIDVGVITTSSAQFDSSQPREQLACSLMLGFVGKTEYREVESSWNGTIMQS